MGRVLITGGSGFIGTKIVERMVRDQHVVLSCDVEPPSFVEHRAYFRELDVLDKQSLKNALKSFRLDWVVHLAASTTLDGRRIGDYDVNIRGVENLICAMDQQTCLCADRAWSPPLLR